MVRDPLESTDRFIFDDWVLLKLADDWEEMLLLVFEPIQIFFEDQQFFPGSF